MANIVGEGTRKLRQNDIKRLRQMRDAGIASGWGGRTGHEKVAP
jgi:hypothetical protein